MSRIKISPVVLHQRFVHPSQQTISWIIKHANMNLPANIPPCVACDVGKSCKLLVDASITEYNNPLELLEMDPWGPVPVSFNGNLYYLSIVVVHPKMGLGEQQFRSSGIINRPEKRSHHRLIRG